jgi:hypothetical protein
MDCSELASLLYGPTCEQSDFGAKISTQCLYPSADPVFVHVAKWGDGWRVTDGGGISRNVLVHGRDNNSLLAGLNEAVCRHSVRTEGGQLFADVTDKEWLPAAILAVANGAALAASVAVDHVTRKADRGLAQKIYESLTRAVPPQHIAREYEYRGKSGKRWRIDFAVLNVARPLLVKAVTPHHNSISANYTAFGDIGVDHTERFSVYRRKLEHDDESLLRQVATIVPLRSLEIGTREALHRTH